MARLVKKADKQCLVTVHQNVRNNPPDVLNVGNRWIEVKASGHAACATFFLTPRVKAALRKALR